jgi:universal stress protein E
MHAYSESARPFLTKGSVHEKHEAEFRRLLGDYELPEHSVHLLEETPTNAIVHCQETLHADITVIAALSRSRLAEAIVGNTADRVLDYVKSDLLIMHPG